MSHVISGLLSKRSEIKGLIEQKQQEIKVLEGQISSIDVTIKIFDPDIDLRTLGSTKVVKKNGYFEYGELAKLILESLRDGTKEVQEILSEVMFKKGLVEDQKEILKLVKVSLIGLRKSKKVEKEGNKYFMK